MLAAAHIDAKALIEDAHAAAARVQAAEIAKAIAAAQEIIARAHESAAQERLQLLAELRHEMGRLVLQTTATVTGKILTAEDQRRLAEETARHLPTES